MYYAEFGKGRPVLLIHNGLGSAEDWSGVIPRLEEAGFRVIVADTRGFGRSTRDKTAYRYSLLAKDYLALLDRLHVRRVFVAGSSDGGIIALEMALAAPSRLRGMFVHGANLDEAGVQRPPLAFGAIQAAVARSAAMYKRLSSTPDDYRQFRNDVDKMPEPGITPGELATIHIPTCVAISDHEESIRPEHSRLIASSIPDARLVILKDVSHFAPLQDPAGFANAIIQCFARR